MRQAEPRELRAALLAQAAAISERQRAQQPATRAEGDELPRTRAAQDVKPAQGPQPLAFRQAHHQRRMRETCEGRKPSARERARRAARTGIAQRIRGSQAHQGADAVSGQCLREGRGERLRWQRVEPHATRQRDAARRDLHQRVQVDAQRARRALRGADRAFERDLARRSRCGGLRRLETHGEGQPTRHERQSQRREAARAGWAHEEAQGRQRRAEREGRAASEPAEIGERDAENLGQGQRGKQVAQCAASRDRARSA
ncbi:MAG: hypothetical protein OEW02_02640 [Myxococcales bacterium]|nr:hypothetical protein [Myxococcales bacterium]